MKHPRFSLLRTLWPVATLLAALLLLFMATSTLTLSADLLGPDVAPGGIEGFLYEPDGTTPVAAGWIDIHDAAGQPWMGADTAPNGYWAIPNLPPGIYFLRAFPPPGLPFAASLPQEVEVLSGQWAAAPLRLTQVRISGYVRDCALTPEVRIEGSRVVASRDGEAVWDVTGPNGEFKLGSVAVGQPYMLQAFPPPETEYAPSPPIPVVPVAAGVVLELCIPPANVTGIVHHPDGFPLQDAWVVVSNESLGRETRTDASGAFLFRGLPQGDYILHVGPPWGSQGLMALDPFPINIPAPDALVDVGVLTLARAPKTVTGRVLNAQTGAGVPDAEVRASQLGGPGVASAPTAPNGDFALSVTAGEWHLTVGPLHPAAEWIFPGPPAWVFFEPPPDAPETKNVILEVFPTNAWVSGRVVCPGGNPCPGEPLPAEIRVELRREEIGNAMALGPDYRFRIPIPAGWYELQVHTGHPLLQAPAPMPVFVNPGQTLDVGDIAFLGKDARLTGQVRNQMGMGIGGVPVVGRQAEGFGWGQAETDASGAYTMPVIGGEWFVKPQPRPEQPYVFSGGPLLARVAPGGTMAGVDFVLNDGSSRIEGAAVDSHSLERIWGLDGWAWAERIVAPPDPPLFYSDAPMWDGGFMLKVAGAHDYWVGVDVPPHAPYVSGSAGPVAVPLAGDVPLAVPLEHKNAAIEGALVVAGTSPPEPAHGVWAEVFGEDEGGHWVSVGVDPHSAGYGLGVIAGTWHVRAWADPASGYAAVPSATVVTVQSGQVVAPVNLAVWPIEAMIGGRVLAPDGGPLPGILVFAAGESPFVGPFETWAESGPDGGFELRVPEGGYQVSAALPADELAMRGWLNPRPVDVPWVSAGSPATGIMLRFQRLDGEIHGNVAFAAGLSVTITHPAYVWGWADSGEQAEAEANVVAGTDTFTYSLRVVSDTVWHVGAVYEDLDHGLFYTSSEETVGVPPAPPVAQAFQDLELTGPWLLPQPFIVSFDATQMQTIIMPDGVELVIPPRALVDSGTVTLFIFPTQELRPEPGREMIGPGYQMWAIDQNGLNVIQFRKNVIMTLSYPPDADLEAQGISEHRLIPVYFSTLAGRWILAEGYMVDTEHNEITLQINHFTTFGVAERTEEQHRVYLPLVYRQY